MEPTDYCVVGIDVGLPGGDLTVLVQRRGNIIEEIKVIDTVSEKFRQNKSGYERKWDTSYTRRVVEDLGLARGVAEGYGLSGTASVIKKAAELLSQYWNDLHVPYVQRDAARDMAKFFKDRAYANRREIERLDERLKILDTLPDTFKDGDILIDKKGVSWVLRPYAEPEPQRPVAQRPYQHFWKCRHHPDAMKNHAEYRTGCEHNCHWYTPRWWDGGFYGEELWTVTE